MSFKEVHVEEASDRLLTVTSIALKKMELTVGSARARHRPETQEDASETTGFISNVLRAKSAAPQSEESDVFN